MHFSTKPFYVIGLDTSFYMGRIRVAQVLHKSDSNWFFIGCFVFFIVVFAIGLSVLFYIVWFITFLCLPITQ